MPVLPGLIGLGGLLLPPHAVIPTATNSSKSTNATGWMRRNLKPRNIMPARVIPPKAYHRICWRPGVVSALWDLGVEDIVKIAVAGAVPVMLAGLVEPKLSVGKSLAPAGLDVSVAVSATLPVKPPTGVKVMVEVFPEVAPAGKVGAVPLTLKLGGIPRITLAPVKLLVTVVLPSRFRLIVKAKPFVASVDKICCVPAASEKRLNANVLPDVEVPLGELTAGPDRTTVKDNVDPNVIP